MNERVCFALEFGAGSLPGDRIDDGGSEGGGIDMGGNYMGSSKEEGGVRGGGRKAGGITLQRDSPRFLRSRGSEGSRFGLKGSPVMVSIASR
jgi:hypothetical protein